MLTPTVTPTQTPIWIDPVSVSGPIPGLEPGTGLGPQPNPCHSLQWFYCFIVKILNPYIILLCTHVYHFFPVSIHYLQMHLLLVTLYVTEIFNRRLPEVNTYVLNILHCIKANKMRDRYSNVDDFLCLPWGSTSCLLWV